ncbi:hypothetical protein Aargi30884_16480 [Amedibacterium intestinale]|jgi:hypothetical protein|uniref:Uncharacterized protein n=1 Tax=Amedibacterium intestinale TaxID=2583452 RepID=A0A6N4TK16_9FIRM|nr:hypothetical protein [Amedibacterium intestinale]BBK22745.1 hypothetical protein Aargi30884_16480 [Amedibacterium intestinale]
MEMTIREAVDRYAELQAQIDGAKLEMDGIKAYIETQAEADLEDTKMKTVEYYGTHGCRVVVQNAATVKPISWVVIKEVLGKTVPDFLKEETKYSLTEVAKTMLANMFKGDYIEDTIENVVCRMTDDPKKQKVLMKRLKGKYKQDMKNIMKYAELDEKDASDYAFMVSEVMAYQNILRIMEASGNGGTVEEAVEKVKSALIVEDTIKVSLEAEE